MIRSIELFSGTGGLALGLQESGFSHEALFEWDLCSCDNLRANVSSGKCPGLTNWKIVQGDVRNVDFSIYADNVKFVAGGPPCQPFSMGGKGLAYNDKRDMFPQAVRAIREIRPQAFVFENVKGLLRKSFSTYFNYIILQLTYPEIVMVPGMTWEEHLAYLEKCHTSSTRQTLKYNVTYRLVNAADYGVPQNRFRVIIVGFREDINANWTFPEKTHSREAMIFEQYCTREYWEKYNLKVPSECPYSKKQLSEIAENCSSLYGLQPWRTVRDAIHDIIDNSEINQGPNRRIAKSYPGHSGSKLDEPSKTIKAGAHGVPGGENMIILDNGSTRYYTVREAARIQTFPDSFIFSSSWTENMRQIGNAVPVQLARIIGQSIAIHLS